MLCALSFSSCTGTGGSANAIGEVYNPDGTPVSSGNSGSGTGGGNTTGASGRPGATEAASGSVSQTVFVELLHELANSGNADGISGQFPNGEDESSKTFFLNLSAQDFGMPADGYMILSLDSDGFAPGLSPHWEDTQFVSAANGMLFFADIPMMRVGSHVTVNIGYYAADGTLIRSGYSSGSVEKDGIPLTIGVIGPPSIGVENATTYGRTTAQGGVLYEVFEYTDAAAVSMTAVNGNEGSTMVVQVNGTTVATTTSSTASAPLSEGCNVIVATASKGDNAPIELKRNVFLVKALSEDDIDLAFPNGTETAADSGIWQYRYSQDDNLKMTVTNNYGGDSVGEHSSIKVEVESSLTSWSAGSIITTPSSDEYTDNSKVEDKVLGDGSHTITVTLSKPLCESVTLEKTITAKMKPIRVRVGTDNGGQEKVHIDFHGADDEAMTGNLYIGVNPHGQYTFSYGGANSEGSCTWRWIKDLGGNKWSSGDDSCTLSDNPWDLYIENKDDRLCYKTVGVDGDDNYYKNLIKVDYVPDMKSSRVRLDVSVRTDGCPYRVDNGNDSDHYFFFSLDDNY